MSDRQADLRILLVRMSSIGDVLMASPVAQSLREAYPSAHISWLVEPMSASIVQRNPYVDEIIVCDLNRLLGLLKHGKWAQFLREYRPVRQQLRERNYQITIDLQGLYKSGFFTWVSGAPRRIGAMVTREPNRVFLTETVSVPKHVTHLSEKYVYLLSALGITPDPLPPVLSLTQADQRSAEEFLVGHGIIDEPYIACCVASSRFQKDWPLERWGALASWVWESLGVRTVLIGGKEQQDPVEHLIRSCPGEIISAVGKTSLLQSAALVQQASVVVGPDTGLTYAGLPTKKPTVVLYGPTSHDWLRDEPHAAVCAHPFACAMSPACGDCQTRECMQAISVDEVYAQVAMHLEGRTSSYPLPLQPALA